MSVIYRPYDFAPDYQGLADLLTASLPEPTTVDTLRREEDALPAGTLQTALLAVSDGDQIIGYGRAIQFPWWSEQRCSIITVVHPGYRRSGIGHYLYDHSERFILAHRLTELISWVSENDPESLQFAEKRGWQVERHIFNSSLDVAKFDETSFSGIIENVQAAGIRFATMAELGDTLENRHRLYDLFEVVSKDVPGDNGIPDFESYHTYAFDPAVYDPDCQYIALKDDQWIGLAWLMYDKSKQIMTNNMTGVLKEYRGRQIALALKLLAIRCARRYNVATLRTNNDSQNGPMLAINRKLGYVSEPGSYRIVKVVSAQN